jgi:two-component system, NarL family, nitrate/nitrite response regulator NarL
MSESAAIAQVNRPLRVLLADDHQFVRTMIRNTLQRNPRFKVCDEVENGAKAVEAAIKTRPDVVILNVTMPIMNGFEAARQIKAYVPESAIVILSANADRQFVEEARKVGVRAYVCKSLAAVSLIQAVEAAVNGQDFVVLE